MRGRGPGDRGSASVWAAACATALCLLFAMILALGQVVAARHRAAASADLAALAAAERAVRGAAQACAAAREVAAAQHARLVRCAVRDEIADVTARVRAGPYETRARSRAGGPSAAGRGVAGKAAEGKAAAGKPTLEDRRRTARR